MNRQTLINVTVTFVEGFLAAWALTGNQLDQNALIGAAAAGLSLVWNAVVKPMWAAYKEV